MKPNKYTEWQAIIDTSTSIIKKLPIFFLAIIACWGLYILDLYKDSYDRGRESLLVVDNDYLTKLEKRLMEGKNEKENTSPLAKPTPYVDKQLWEGKKGIKSIIENTVKYQKFRNGSDIIDAIKEEISTEKDNRIRNRLYAADIISKQFAASQYKASENRAKNNQADLTLLWDRTDSGLQDLNEGVYKTIQQEQQDAKDKYEIIANNLKPQWLGREFVYDNTSSFRLYPLFEPTLNEKSGLHIIYQVLWLALVGVVIFSLVFAILKVFRTVLFGQNAEVFTEQVKELLVVNKGGTAPTMAKTALLSLAALSTATAVVAGGVAVNSKANQALDSVAEVRMDPETAVNGKPKYKLNPLINSDTERPPLQPTPTPTPDPTGGTAEQSPLNNINNQLTEINQTLKNYPNIDLGQVSQQLTTINESVRQRSSTPLTASLTIPPETQAVIDNLPTNTNISNFGGSIKEFAQSLTTLSGTFAKCCENSQPSSVPFNPDVLKDIQRNILNLQETMNRIQASNAASFKPYRPGVLTNILPPYGDDQYKITPGSFAALKYAMEGIDEKGTPIPATGEKKHLLEALRQSIGDPPKKKKEFLNDLNRLLVTLITNASSSTSATPAPVPAPKSGKSDGEELHAVLQKWRKTILTLTAWNEKNPAGR